MILNGREVEIDEVEVEVFQNRAGVDCNKDYDERVMILSWSGNIGFGEYTLYTDREGKWHGDSETMDRGEDKEFIRLLLDKFVEGLEIEN